MSKKLIQTPEIIKKRIPFTIDCVKQIINPTGTQTKAAPNIGINEANINKTESKREPSILKQIIIIKATIPWYKATKMYPEKRFFVMSENFSVNTFMCFGARGIAFLIKESKYGPSRKQKYKAKTMNIRETRNEPVVVTTVFPIEKIFAL